MIGKVAWFFNDNKIKVSRKPGNKQQENADVSRFISSVSFSYFLFIYNLPRCILPDFPYVSSLAFLPLLSCCHHNNHDAVEGDWQHLIWRQSIASVERKKSGVIAVSLTVQICCGDRLYCRQIHYMPLVGLYAWITWLWLCYYIWVSTRSRVSMGRVASRGCNFDA